MTRAKRHDDGRSTVNTGVDTPRAMDRRTVFRGMTGAVGAAALAPQLGRRTATAQDATPAGTASPVVDNGFVRSTVEGVPDVCLKLPQPYKSTSGTPGSGGTVRAFTISYAAPTPGRDSNQYWQELEKRLGVTWEVIETPQPDYGEKSTALLASGDLPDLFYINPNQGASQQYQALAQGAFTDLTPFVTGDSLKQFPNLATFPAFAWNNSKFQGKTYGIPLPTGVASDLPFYRSDWATTLGIQPTRTLGPDTVMQLLTGFTTGDPDGNGNPDTWGTGRYGDGWAGWDNGFAMFLHRVPQEWRLNGDGTMTAAVETDEFRQALQFLTNAYAAGAYYPDAAGMTYTAETDAFVAGKTGFHTEAFGSFFGTGGVTDKLHQVNPNAAIEYFVPHGADGKPGVTYNNPGFFGMVAIPASITDKDRIAELLRILDYLAAPFGSEEWLFKNYGIEGVDFTRDDKGNPISTDKGTLERGALTYFVGSPQVIFYPDNPEDGLIVQKGQYDAVAVGIDNPALTLYSPANIEKGPALNQFATDQATQIVTGRQSFDSLDGAIAEWRSRGGDDIRKEYEDALKQLSGG